MLNLGGIQVQIDHTETIEDLDKLAGEIDDLMHMIRKKQIELVMKDPKNWEILLAHHG